MHLSRLSIIQKNLKFFFSILVFIFIFSLPSGPFIPNLIVSLSALFSLIIFKKQLTREIFKFNIFFYLISFYFFFFLSSIFSEFFAVSLKSSLPYLRFIIFIFAASHVIHKYELHNYIFYVFFSLYLILFFDSLLQASTGYNLLNMKLTSDRVSSFFDDEYILGSFISKSYGILLLCLFSSKIEYKNILYIFVSLISLILIILSNERSALLIFVIIFLLSIVLIPNKIKFYLILIMITFTCLIFYLNKSTYDRIIYLTYNQLTENNTLNIFSFRHQLHYITAIEIFKENKIKGAGIKSFRYLCGRDVFSKKPHQKIEEKRKIFAKHDGIVRKYEIEDNDYDKYYAIDNNILPKDIQREYLKNNGTVRGFKKEVQVQYLNKYHYFSLKKSLGELVYKGDHIWTWYEFKNGCNTHPHNFYIQFLSELGLFGFLFLILTYLFIMIKVFNFFKKDSQISVNNYLILSIYLAILFPFVPSGNFFNNYLSIQIFLPLCFLKLWKFR